MSIKFQHGGLCAICALLLALNPSAAQAVEAVFENFSQHSPVEVKELDSDTLRVTWPISTKARGEVILNLAAHQPLIRSLGTATGSQPVQPIATQLDPVMTLTIGERDKDIAAKAFRNMVFFEKLNRQPHAAYAVKLVKDRVRVVGGAADRVTVRVGSIKAGSFNGDLQFTFYPNCPLVHVETVISTKDELRATLYDTGLSSETPDWESFAWMDSVGGGVQHRAVADAFAPTPQAVKYRAMVAEGRAGSVAVFALPHRYFYPLDQAENLKFTWFGRGYREMPAGLGFGIRQPLDGDNRFVPWFDAPAGVEHRLGVFYLLTPGNGEQALKEVAAYTRQDRFKHLPGYQTFETDIELVANQKSTVKTEMVSGGPAEGTPLPQ